MYECVCLLGGVGGGGEDHPGPHRASGPSGGGRRCPEALAGGRRLQQTRRRHPTGSHPLPHDTI